MARKDKGQNPLGEVGDLFDDQVPEVDKATKAIIQDSKHQGKTAAQIKKLKQDRERVKKTIDIDSTLKKLLEEAAAENGVSESNLIAYLAFVGLQKLEEGEVDFNRLLIQARSPKLDFVIEYGDEVEKYAEGSRFSKE